MAKAQEVSQLNQQYFILLLITDGIINDMQKTIDEIVNASSLPLSIIIVGVGNEDFESMNQLDADEEPLYSEKYKKIMDRDIVQFVPFREFKDNPILLAKQTLEEVPNQLLSFFEKQKIVPKQVLEQEKRKIMSQLSKQNTGRSMEERYQPPEYFVDLKEKFLQKCLEMGLDLMEVKEFIEDKGIPEMNFELIMDYLKDASYRNPLKSLGEHHRSGSQQLQQRSLPQQAPVNKASHPKQRQSMNYEYYDQD